MSTSHEKYIQKCHILHWTKQVGALFQKKKTNWRCKMNRVVGQWRQKIELMQGKFTEKLEEQHVAYQKMGKKCQLMELEIEKT